MRAINRLAKKTIVFLVVSTLLFNSSTPVVAHSFQKDIGSLQSDEPVQSLMIENEVPAVEELSEGDSQALQEFSAEGTSLGSSEELVENQVPILEDVLEKEAETYVQAQPLKLHLEASPQLILPDEPVTISWSLSGAKTAIQAKTDTILEVQIPLGLASSSEIGDLVKTTAEDITAYEVQTEELKGAGYAGEFVLKQTGKGEAPYLVSFILKSGDEVLASNSILLSEGQFFVDSSSKSRSSIESNNVSLDFFLHLSG